MNYLGMIQEIGFIDEISYFINSYLLDDKRVNKINHLVNVLYCDYEYDKFENKKKYYTNDCIKAKDLTFGKWVYCEKKIKWKYSCKIQDHMYYRIPIYIHDMSLYNFICKNNDIGDYHNEILHDLFEYDFKNLVFNLWNTQGYTNYDIIKKIKSGHFVLLWDSIKDNFAFI